MSRLTRLRLILSTARHLRWEQILYRIFYRVRPLRLKPLDGVTERGALNRWAGHVFLPSATDDGLHFTFLGQAGSINAGWNNPEYSKLWLYNLHYLDDLNALGAAGKHGLCQQLVNDWIAGNPPLTGNGWEPYPLSLRLVNLVKWFSRQVSEDVQPEWDESVALQAQALMEQIEWHILGNHLFANGKALVFAGTWLGGGFGDRCLTEGLKILDREIPEQFLADGGHFERSPMYHATMLWDLCDLLQLTSESQLPELVARRDQWQHVLRNGLDWLSGMLHPDEGISFFNDAAFGIAPDFRQLSAYAASLGVSTRPESETGFPAVQHFSASGYITLDMGHQARAILDVAKVGPDYLPGHAHADTLSFELSLFGQRLLVNSGTSQYGEGEERQRQRSTHTHNTVVVDGQTSSEVWAGFRVARRAYPFDVSVSERQGQVAVKAKHDGYRRLPGKPTHQRCWVAEQGELLVEDEITGSFQSAEAYFYCHPDVKLAAINDTEWQATMPSGEAVTFTFSGAQQVKQLDSTWHPEFGKAIANQCLKVRFADSTLKTQLTWSPR